MTLPKSLTTVTSFSKILATVLFITLPFLGFYLGMEYEKTVIPNLPEWVTSQSTQTLPSGTTTGWKTYTNKLYEYSVKYPKDSIVTEATSAKNNKDKFNN